ERPSQQSEGMERMVQSYQIMLSFFGLLALLVGLFLVTNSVSIAVAERRREIGTLRALGAPRRSILWLFVSEALFIGIVGSVIGVGLGRILAEAMLDEVSRSISTQYLTTIKTNRIIFEWKTIVEAMFLGTTAAVAAAFWPSWKATRIHPLEAMKKTEVVESGSNLFNWSTILGLFILAYYTLSMKLEWFAIHKVFDLLNNISSMVGPALVGPVLVTILILIFKKIFSRTWGTVTRLSADNLVRNPRRTASNVTTLMVGLVLVTTISALNISFKQTIVGWFSKVLYPDFLISAQGNLITYQTQPVHESLAQEIDKIPGVKIASNGGAHAVRFIHFQYEGKQLGMKNFDEPDPDSNYSIFDVKDRDPIVAGKELYHSSEPTVMVSQNFVLHFGKKTGDVMTIATPTGPVDFKIVGVVVDFASPEGIIYQSRQSFKKIWNDHLVDAFGIKVAHGFDSEVVRANLEKVLGPKNLMITSNFELRNQIVKSVDQSFAYTKAIEAAALMVAALGLLNTFLISIMERKRELGMLRAIGMARSQMTSMILKEAAIQGALGAIVAVAFGTWISSMWISGSLAHALGWIIEFTFPWEGVIKTVGVGVLVTLVAGLYPAWKAATSEIREALEYE
ncbi:MAG: ABC transporter permease, partial [Oligoflexia bacterium]|nr:ABC transporter permease [Oligoflexia bacterium]